MDSPQLKQMMDAISKQASAALPETIFPAYQHKVGRRAGDNMPMLSVATPIGVFHFPLPPETLATLRLQLAQLDKPAQGAEGVSAGE